MPRIKSTLNGEVSNVRADIAREMVKMGVATALDSLDALSDTPSLLPRYQHPAAPTEPRWQIETVGLSKKELVIRMSILGQVYYFSGNPASANKTVAWDGGSRFLNGFGRAIPKQILEAYREQWNANESLRGPEGDGSAAALWRASGVE
jgi:hypothetical protein